MKKIFLSATLALTMASSWAFSPSQPYSGTYMEVILASGSFTTVITVITPDGKVEKTEMQGHNSAEARGKMIVKLNELGKNGWQVVRMNFADETGGYIREVYFLEK